MRAVHQIIGLVGWIASCFAVAWFGSQFMPGEWYAGLAKPDWTPPKSLFAPVWTILYTAMAIAAWLVWRKTGFSGAKTALILFLAQLIFNGVWSWLFFGRHLIGIALLDIIFLVILIILTAMYFWRISRPAGIIMLPYFTWVSFATILNFTLWRLN
nr:tryptophan-rich sensory protein [candidate division Zixibacteria bacterium]